MRFDLEAVLSARRPTISAFRAGCRSRLDNSSVRRHKHDTTRSPLRHGGVKGSRHAGTRPPGTLHSRDVSTVPRCRLRFGEDGRNESIQPIFILCTQREDTLLSGSWALQGDGRLLSRGWCCRVVPTAGEERALKTKTQERRVALGVGRIPAAGPRQLPVCDYDLALTLYSEAALGKVLLPGQDAAVRADRGKWCGSQCDVRVAEAEKAGGGRLEHRNVGRREVESRRMRQTRRPEG